MTLSNIAPRTAGRHFLQIPGPSPIPDRVLRAMAMPIIDHRGPEAARLTARVLEAMQSVIRTAGPVIIYPASGTGAWEAALTNTLSPGDRVLMFESGHFAAVWKAMADRLGLQVEFLASDWRSGVDAGAIEQRLREDAGHTIKAVCVVHNETSTGTLSSVQAVRAVLDAVGHPALLMVDTISSLGSADYRHDDWGVDVTVAGSQKGLMLPPGLSFNAVSAKALERSRTAKLPHVYLSWDDMLKANARGAFPYTPATNLLYALAEAVQMLHEEGLDRVFARHLRHAEAVRRAVRAWGLEIFCSNPAHYSPVVTAVVMPDGKGADAFRALALKAFDISLGQGLGKLTDQVFRIGHLGDTNDLTILGALAGVEMTLQLAAVPHQTGGVQAAMAYLAETVVTSA
jgi:alanine-glyoxylate transaminase/serine-glyoxylate transaminase/serine-pyruvate transaminase